MSDEKKIFIDEGWKAQVQREKEEAARRQAEEAARKQAEAPAEAPAAPEQPVQAAAPEALEGEEGPIEANFVTLVASLATQAMFALGAMAQPGSQQVMVNLDQAEFSIETLKVLQDKTQGNLNEEEQAHLTEAISELQRLFAMRIQQFQEQTMRQAGADPTNLKGQ